MNEEEFINNYTCPNCRFEWTVFEKEMTESTKKLCDYCEKKPNMNNIEKIERYLSIMPSTLASALPIMLREIWKVIKEIKNEVDKS